MLVIYFLLLFSPGLFSYNTPEIQELLTKSFAGRALFGDLFELNINGHPLRVHIRKVNESEKTAIIISPPEEEVTDEEIDSACLYLSISPANQGELSWLSSKDDSGKELRCGIPASIKQKGGFLLSFVDQVALHLRLSSVSLVDASSIWCPRNRKFLSLRVLNLMKNLPAWYIKNGYLPEDLEKYDESSASLINLKMNDVFERIINIDIDQISRLIKEYGEKKDKDWEAQQFKISEVINYWKEFARRREILKKSTTGMDLLTTNLADFARGLQSGPCDIYSEVIDLIFPPLNHDEKLMFVTREFQGFFPWYKDYESFYSTGLNLVKRHKKHKRSEEGKQ